MNILNNGRFGMGAALAGTQRAALRQAAEHAATRVQFGKRLIEFGTIQVPVTAVRVESTRRRPERMVNV